MEQIISEKIFNFVFALVVGRSAFGSCKIKEPDIWGHEAGVKFLVSCFILPNMTTKKQSLKNRWR